MSERGSADAVEEFLELEAELSSGTKRAETYDQGNVAGVAKIPREEVPDGYPVPIGTRQALHLDVETPDGETVATYLEWPGEDEQSDHVERLLDALGRSRDEFANVYGDRVALDAVDGWHGIDPERTAALRNANRTSGDDAPTLTRNLLAGAVATAVVGISLTNPLPDLGAPLMLLSWLAIPALLYYDGTRVEESTHWSPKQLRWAGAGLVPIANVAIGAAYLVERRVRLSGTTASDAAGTWNRSVITGLVLTVVGFILVGSLTNVGVPLFLYSYAFLPFAVYFDAKYTDEATDWNPNGRGWAAAALLGPLGVIAYLLVRRGELG